MAGTTTTTGAGRKNTRHIQGATGTVLQGVTATCAAEGIQAVCEHTGAKEGEKAAPKSGAGGSAAHTKSAAKPAPPAPAPKPGEAAPQPEDKRRFAKEEAEAPPPAPTRPGQPAPPPPKPAAEALVLQVVPTAAPDDDEKGASVKVTPKEGPHVKTTHDSSEVGLVKHVAGTGKGDQITLLANKKGTAAKCPEWIITDHGTGQGAAKKEERFGTPLKYIFLPPDPSELGKYIIQNPFFKMGWLDVVKPRHYTVVCKSPFPAPPASHAPAGHPRPAPGARHPQAPAVHQAPASSPGEHHTLEVDVYPSDKWTVKLTTEEKAFKPPWEETLEKVKKEIEGLIDHLTELASAGDPAIPNVKIKLMEGELSLSNFWEEKEGSHLVHWKAKLEGGVTFIDLTLKFNVDSSKFLKAAESFSRAAKTAEKAAEKFAKILKGVGVTAEASLYISIGIKIALNGEGSWEQEEKGTLTANLEELKVELTAGAGVGGELEVDWTDAGKKKTVVKFSGDGTTEMTLATSPRLGPSAALWLDNKFSWHPLKVTLEAVVNPKGKAKKDALPDKSTQAAPSLPELTWNWSGDLAPVIKDKPLPSLNLTTRQWGPAPAGEQKPLAVKQLPLPRLTPASAPPLKIVPTPLKK